MKLLLSCWSSQTPLLLQKLGKHEPPLRNDPKNDVHCGTTFVHVKPQYG